MSQPDGDADFRTLLIQEMRILIMQAAALAANHSLAEDLVQDTVERALLNQDQFCRGTSLRSWLIRIMRNRFIDHCRETIRHGDGGHAAAIELDEPIADEPEPPRPWDLLGDADLAAALRKIEEPMRDTFVMANFRGLSYQAIARMTGVRVSTVGTRLLRARTRLRAILLDELIVTKGVWTRRASLAPLRD